MCILFSLWFDGVLECVEDFGKFCKSYLVRKYANIIVEVAVKA